MLVPGVLVLALHGTVRLNFSVFSDLKSIAQFMRGSLTASMICLLQRFARAESLLWCA